MLTFGEPAICLGLYWPYHAQPCELPAPSFGRIVGHLENATVSDAKFLYHSETVTVSIRQRHTPQRALHLIGFAGGLRRAAALRFEENCEARQTVKARRAKAASYLGIAPAKRRHWRKISAMHLAANNLRPWPTC